MDAMKQALLPFLLKRTPEAAAPEGVSNTADDTRPGTGSEQLGAGVSGTGVMAGDTAGVITDGVDVDVDVAVAVAVAVGVGVGVGRPKPPPQAVIATATDKGKIRRKGAWHREAMTLDIRVSYGWGPLQY